VIFKPEEQLSQLFGSYKAEWLKGKLYEFFTEPSYFPELKTSRPCMLIGGRGTGKTTALRCLSYEGQFALSQFKKEEIPNWNYYGLYYRVNTNRVTAFKGPELEDKRWKNLFAHYFNLLICDLLLKFLAWYKKHVPYSEQLDENACNKIGKSLNLQDVKTTRDLVNSVDNLRIEFEAFINNVATQPFPLLSAQGAPIDTLIESITQLQQFQDKTFFFLLDEYENFEDYQQQVVNTLIKHSGQHYSFKIGVRELGLRCRNTLNENEQLIHPADYVRINIAEKLAGSIFNDFALQVCNTRISKLRKIDESIIDDVSKALPALSENEEALKLGISDLIKDMRDILRVVNGSIELSPLELYFIKIWAEGKNLDKKDVLKEYMDKYSDWTERFSNYKHALLYSLRKGKVGIRKYYAGWDTFIKLSATNIRYLLELVDQTLLLHLKKGRSLSEPVSFETQTLAAQNSGKKNLSELEGLSIHGAKLTKLLLGLGRIFQVMAVDVSSHAPEVNQFYIDDNLDSTQERLELEDLLTAAVMHLALIRFSGNKPVDEADTKDYDYMIHPIYSPFFIFSYRKKRKMKMSGTQLLGLISNPRDTIREVLEQNNRDYEEELPDQLRLFEEFYFGHSG